MAVLFYIFVFCTVILVAFYFLVWGKLLKQPNTALSDFSPPISIVICAKNEAKHLKSHLTLVLRQDYPVFEVVLVDDASIDGTAQIVQSLSLQYPNLRYLLFDKPKKNAGKKEVLDFGVRQSKYEHLLLTDADCKPLSDQWIQTMVNGFSDGSDVVLGVSLFNNLQNSASRFAHYDAAFIAMNYLAFSKIGFPYMSVGRNVAYKKELFFKVGGFSNHLNVASGDDDLFINDLPKGVQFNQIFGVEAQTVSAAMQSYKSLLKQKKRHVSAGFRYKFINLLLLVLYYSITTLWWGAFFVLLVDMKCVFAISTLFVLKNLTMYSFITRIFSKIGVSVKSGTAIVLDVLSISFHNLAVFYSLFKRDSGKW